MARQRAYSDWTNGSGYRDGTAGEALNNVMRRSEGQSERPRRVTQVWRAPEEQKNQIIESMMSGKKPERKENTMNTQQTARIEMITPEMAAEYLTHNTANFRKPTKGGINRYVRDLLAGKWQLNGETIKFYASGRLKDGQNRLHAIIKAGRPAESWVIRGIPDEYTICDSGMKRTVAQLAGVSNNAASIANLICIGFKGMNTAPTGICQDYAAQHREDLMAAVSICNTGSRSGVITAKKPIMTAVYMLLRSGANEDDLRNFIKVVNTGFSVEGWESSAGVAFANYIRRTFIDHRYLKDRTCMAEAITVTINAFNDFTAGRKRTIAYRKTSNTAEAKRYMDWIRHEDGLE